MSRRNARSGGGGGAGAALAIAEAAVLAIPSLYSFLDAALYTTATTNVASFVDRVPAGQGVRAITANHAFAQASGGAQVVIPVAQATLANQPAAQFAGAQYYDSTAPASAWTLLNSGPCESLTVMRFEAGGANPIPWSTYNVAVGSEVYLLTNSWFYRYLSLNDTGDLQTYTTPYNIPLRCARSGAASFVNKNSGGILTSATAADMPLRIGAAARTVPANYLTAKVAAHFVFSALLTDAQRAALVSYTALRWNVV